MVFITRLLRATLLLSSIVSALPMPMQEDPATQMNEYNMESSESTMVESSPMEQLSSAAMGEESTSTMVDHETTSSAMMDHETSSESAMPHEATSSVMAHETTSSVMAHETTTTAEAAYSTPAYGSGSSGSSAYNDCVQQCVATFGAPGEYTPTATVAAAPTESAAEGSSGGATHTVIVSPSQGVLRYVPFALNASVGDTVQFMWGANNHTVTKGSQLLPCNKSAEEPSFTSGLQQKDFMFTEVVNTTDPTFIFCNTPTPDGANHCAKGMFFILNPPTASGAGTSVGGMMQAQKAANPNLEAYATYTDNATDGMSMASWGTNLDIGGMPEWSHSLVMENVLYTRNVFAANPDMEAEDGSWSVGNMGGNPMVIPMDVSQALASTNPDASASSGNNGALPSASASGSDTAAGQSGALNENSGFSVSSSKLLLALAVVFTSFFALFDF